MNAVEIRMQMKEEGWDSEDCLTSKGWGKAQKGYSIWFDRYDWHGWVAANGVCFRGSTSNLNEINELVAKVAEAARKAWNDFPDTLPYQSSLDNIIADPMDEIWKKHRFPTKELDKKTGRRIPDDERRKQWEIQQESNKIIIISDGQRAYSEIMPEWILEHYEDCGPDESFKEWTKPIEVTSKEIAQYNGNHFIFGWYESFLQSENWPNWATQNLLTIKVKNGYSGKYREII